MKQHKTQDFSAEKFLRFFGGNVLTNPCTMI